MPVIGIESSANHRHNVSDSLPMAPLTIRTDPTATAKRVLPQTRINRAHIFPYVQCECVASRVFIRLALPVGLILKMKCHGVLA